MPTELFVGRRAEIEYVLRRGAAQVAAGKPVALFVQGEFGIGKSSFAAYLQEQAEHRYHLHPVYVSLGGCKSLTDVGSRITASILASHSLDRQKADRLREWVGTYVKQANVFGVVVNTEAVKKAPPILSDSNTLLGFLREVLSRLGRSETNGLFLALDEIDGITNNAEFTHLIKGLVDTNGISRDPLPLLLMLCGVEERRQEMIRQHQPIERVFDLVQIDALTQPEGETFFRRAFDEVNVTVDDEALSLLCFASAGFPKIMHEVGEAAYWRNTDAHLDADEAFSAILDAADVVGKKYVDNQIYKELRSNEYRSILNKIALSRFAGDLTFRRAEITPDLTPEERHKLANFLRRMRELKVIRAGEGRGEYVFNVRMVRMYLWLSNVRTTMADDGGFALAQPSGESRHLALADFLPDELALLRCLAAGMPNREIATVASLSESTVRTKLSVLFRKIGVADRTQAAIYAVSHGIAGGIGQDSSQLGTSAQPPVGNVNDIRVVLADPHQLFRQGLKALLELERGISIVGEASDGLEVQRVSLEQNANVVLMEINMPIVDGLSATRELMRSNPEIGVIILSTQHEEEYVFQAMRGGARGYLLKSSRISEVAGAVRAVASGLSLLDPTITKSLVSEFKRMSSKQTPEDGLGQLTETEIKILQHVSAGMSNKEIAQKLSLAESTVKNRLSVLFEKIGVLDRTQAAIYAITHGIAPTAVQSR